MRTFMNRRPGVLATALVLSATAIGLAQQAAQPPQQRPAMSPAASGIGQDEAERRTEPPATRFFYPTGPDVFVPLPAGPQEYDSMQYRIRVVTLVNGLSRPFSMAFLPNGDILLTE